MVAIFSLTVLVSAFLLFAVQPMVAKMLLPILGGSASVWNTAMVFYQGALLLGYLYAHGVSKKLSLRAQVVTHGVLLVLPFLVLPLAYGELHPPTTGNPAPWMLLTMAMSVGLPFFVLSATSPLLQTWFSRAGGGDPYFLYAASNVGSFVGLLAYPFLIEPKMSVAEQSSRWTWGYALLVMLFGITLARMIRVSPPHSKAEVESLEPIPLLRKLKWLFLAFIPSSHFIGVTTYLSTDIAVMPLLWVIPLAIYLLSMVLVFAKKPPIPHRLVVAAFPILLAGLVFLIAARLGTFRMPIFGAHLIVLFAGAMLCHGELAKDRPSPGRLTEFFLIMSIGGVLGGIFNAMFAPTIFRQVVEYSLVLIAIGMALPHRQPGWTSRLIALDIVLPEAVVAIALAGTYLYRNVTAVPEWVSGVAIGVSCILICFFAARPLRFTIGIAGMLIVGVYAGQVNKKTLFADRSFFGVYRVEQWKDTRTLLNGRILHGEQIMRPEIETVPLTYYHVYGPLQEVLGTWPRPLGAKVGAVGLGIGTVALWSRAGEQWTFFEIDPMVEQIARDPKLFTCLAKAKGNVTVTLGDARLQLQRTDEKFDVLLVDAFSSDAIPAHLMTAEAMEVYRSRLTPKGLLAVHISNKFLDLEPLVAALADKMGWKAMICHELRHPIEGPMSEGRTESVWMVLGPPTLDWTPFLARSRWEAPRERTDIQPWTDAYSSLLPLLRKSAFRVF